MPSSSVSNTLLFRIYYASSTSVFNGPQLQMTCLIAAVRLSTAIIQVRSFFYSGKYFNVLSFLSVNLLECI